MGTFEAAKMVACKWLWVLAGQICASCQFEQVWCCIIIRSPFAYLLLDSVRLAIFKLDAVPQTSSWRHVVGGRGHTVNKLLG